MSGSTSRHCAADPHWPTRGAGSPNARWRSRRCASAPVVPSRTGSTGLPTTSATGWRGCAACRPLSTLRRGYAVVQTAGGDVVTDPASVGAGDLLDVRVADGRIGATVTNTLTEGTDNA